MSTFAATTWATVLLQALLSRERRAARKHRLDDGLLLAWDGTDRDPVADGRQLVVRELAGGEAAHWAELREQLARPVVARGDARRNQIVLSVWLECVCEERIPAELFEVQTNSFGSRDTRKHPERARAMSLRSAGST